MTNRKTICPKCSHTRKNKTEPCLSITINHEGEKWNCHHCGYSGFKKTNNVVYMKKEYKKPQFVKTALDERAIAYFTARGVSAETLNKMAVASLKHYFPSKESEVSCVAFPFYKNGEVVNIKYRTGDKHFTQSKDAEKIYFNLDGLKGQEIAIHVEGEIDALSFIEAGFNNVISVPDGAPNSFVKEGSKKFEFIDNSAEFLIPIKKHILAFDNDNNGRILTEEVASRLGKEFCYLVDFADCKDANEYLVKYGKEALKKVIEGITPYPISGIHTLTTEEIAKVQFYIENAGANIYKTGFECLDEFYKVRAGEVTIVTGIPNSGKSDLLDNILVNLAKGEHKFGICSLENPTEEHWCKLAEKAAGIARANKKDFSNNFAGIMEWLQERFFIVASDEEVLTIDWILDKARLLSIRHGIMGFVIDPYNYIQHERKNNESETDYVARFIRKVKNFAKQYKIAIWIVAHPRKVEGRPSAYDISGSAHWFNMADNIMVVHRNYDAKTTEVHIDKIRFQPAVGTRGMATLRFNLGTRCFYE